jgi:hypothetical protein
MAAARVHGIAIAQAMSMAHDPTSQAADSSRFTRVTTRRSYDTGGASLARGALAMFVALSALVVDANPAAACGGFISPPQETQSITVTDQRMAFSISKERTILWDQIVYSGNPSEFVWTLPVKPGTVVQLSSDHWMAALDKVSQPEILSPPGYQGGGGDGSGGGCNFQPGCGGQAEYASSPMGAATPASPPPVDVVGQAVVGPYDTVTLRSTNPNALEDWLTSHGYKLPDAFRPVVKQYVNEGFDFFAMRLRPGQGVSAMQPVRIITPGADVSLPLRSVAAGAGANVAITLFVLGEGRYHPQNFPDGTIDFTKLVWDGSQDRSNYPELATAAMAANGGTSFITEFADHPGVSGGGNNLAGLYYGECTGPRPDETSPPPSADDAGLADFPDAGVSADDAATDDAGVDEAGADEAGAAPDGGTTVSTDAGFAPPPVDPNSCAALDDLVVATQGMTPDDVWLTRLRANLPVGALSTDLKLEASASQTPEDNQHTASTYASIPATASIAPATKRNAGSILLGIFTSLFVVVRLRRTRSR